jgi:arylsulfatase A-like enzyme
MKPHILFIFPDQLRRTALSSEDGPVPTPHMDRLKREGSSFRSARVNYPMCTPSRATLLTGRPAHALRDHQGEPYLFNDRQLDPEETTYAHVLTDAGYQCSYVGKWHNRDQRGFVPRGKVRLGFDHQFRGSQTGSPLLNPFDYDDQANREESEESWAPFMESQRVLDIFRSGHRDAPQLVSVSFNPPHQPYDVLPPELEYLFEEARQRIKECPPNVPESLQESAMDLMANYHALVMGIDLAVGRLLDGLAQLGILDDTLVVLSSDHGDQLLSHGLQGKNQFYEESLNVPLIFRLPGIIPEGQCLDTMVSSCDIAPTLLDFAGVAVPERMLGHSLKPVLQKEKESVRSFMVSEVCHPWYDWFHGQGSQGNRRCLITAEDKLVVKEDGTGAAVPCQFFDLVKDPYELNNVVHDPGAAALIGQRGKELLY